jgi:hypothetical protein
MLYAVTAEVLGFSTVAPPRSSTVKVPSRPKASMRPIFSVVRGSATSVISVRSKPNPLKAIVAARLAFFGKSVCGSICRSSKEDGWLGQGIEFYQVLSECPLPSLGGLGRDIADSVESAALESTESIDAGNGTRRE